MQQLELFVHSRR